MAKQMVCGIMRDLDAEMTAYRRKELQIRLAANYLDRERIQRVCAQNELEPDEFLTAEQKARLFGLLG